MKVLIAEENISSSETLKSRVENMGCEVVTAYYGSQAWKILESEDALSMVIMSWSLKGVSGLDFCQKVKESSSVLPTYMILMFAQEDKQHIIPAIESGANDYLLKPIDAMELDARIRIGLRTLELQQERQHLVKDLESIFRRHSILGDILQKQSTNLETKRPAVKAQHTPSTPSQLSPKINELRSVMGISQTFVQALEQMGIGPLSPLKPSHTLEGDQYKFMMLAALYLREMSTWIELIVEMSRDAATMLCVSMLGQPPSSDGELLDALGEVLNIVQGSFKTKLIEDGVTTLMPLIPQALLKGEISAVSESNIAYVRYCFDLSGNVIRFTVTEHQTPIRKKTVSEISEFDILATSVQSIKNKDMIYLNEGTLLDSRYIKKIHELLMLGQIERCISTFESTPLVKIFSSKKR